MVILHGLVLSLQGFLLVDLRSGEVVYFKYYHWSSRVGDNFPFDSAIAKENYEKKGSGLCKDIFGRWYSGRGEPPTCLLITRSLKTRIYDQSVHNITDSAMVFGYFLQHVNPHPRCRFKKPAQTNPVGVPIVPVGVLHQPMVQ